MNKPWFPRLIFLTHLLQVSLAGATTNSAGMADTLDFTKLIPKTMPRTAMFQQPGWFLWDPCIIRGEDGGFYLFYSRWPTQLGYDAWCTHAEIAWAKATNAAGPYAFQGVALATRGAGFWDGHAVFNPCVVSWHGHYYLYYTGNYGSSDWSSNRRIPADAPAWWVQRNHQRIGVAVANRPTGPWQRPDKPLLDIDQGFGCTILNVPNIVIKPDGTWRIYYKTLTEGQGFFGGGVFHFEADADNPLGPFVPYAQPMIDKNKLMPQVGKPFRFHIDDHFEWIQDGRYYAIVKDHDAPFLTKFGRSLLLFESPDGRQWRPSAHVLVKDFSIHWEHGPVEHYSRLEMPKLLLTAGHPRILSLAALPEGGDESFLVLVPLQP